MFGRTLRSALFIDFENVAQRSMPERIANWTQWLEDGEFDTAGKKRRLVEKRIYWNSSAEKHREQFTAAGFEVILCEKFAALKNGADIRMALDIAECLHAKRRRIDEYILFTRDSDFVPVLRRLNEHAKQTVILVDESNPSRHTAFSHYADIMIPMRRLGDAASYVRPKRTLLGRLKAGAGNGAAKAAKGAAAATPVAAGSAAKGNGATKPVAGVVPADGIEQAVTRVIRIASRKPNQQTAQRDIEQELAAVTGFAKQGAAKYLGTGTYRALMQEIDKRSGGRIRTVVRGNGGVTVTYVPKDDGDEPAPA